MKRMIPLALCAALLSGCGDSGYGEPAPTPRFSAELARTTHGVAHVRAGNFSGIGYGLAYAYAEDNICMLADTMLTVRGERSRYFGGAALPTAARNGEYSVAIDYLDLKGFDLNNEDSDFFFKAYLDLDQLRAGYAAGRQEIRDLLAGYVAGYNRYLREHAATLPAACNGKAWVKPISVDDMYLLIAEKALHGSGQVFAREIVAAGRSPGAAPALRAAKAGAPDLSDVLNRMNLNRLGSNGLALGRDASGNGRGILLGNPHYPWTSTDRFYQVHLTVPGVYDAMGASIGGVPMVVIGFNKDVAWTHTVTKAAHFTTFRLTLDTADRSGTTYLMDGVPVKMRSKSVEVASLQADGSLARKIKDFYFSEQGAVLVKPEVGIDWSASHAYVLADANRNNTRLLEQWLAMGQAGSIGALKASLDRIAGLPWVNMVAADRDGNTMFADTSVVPHMETAKFVSDCFLLPAMLTFDGSRRACGWGRDEGMPDGIFAPARAPYLMRDDYVANSNDGYWLANTRAPLTGPAPWGYSPLYGAIGVEQGLRARIGFIQIDAALATKRRLQLSDVEAMLFANRVYAAELVLPDLLQACAAERDALLVSACAVLAAWDRKADLDSRGAVLFREFWSGPAGNAAAIAGKWRVPLNPADPVNTPGGVAPAAMPAMLASLKAAALRMRQVGVPMDGRLGDYQSDTRNGVRVPIHGAVGDIDGAYNSIHMATALEADGYRNVVWGTSYIQLVGFEQAGPLAQGLLVYGQSTDPKSPYYGDQVPMYSAKRLAVLPFTPEQMRADPKYQVKTLTEQ